MAPNERKLNQVALFNQNVDGFIYFLLTDKYKYLLVIKSYKRSWFIVEGIVNAWFNLHIIFDQRPVWTILINKFNTWLSHKNDKKSNIGKFLLQTTAPLSL